MSKSITCSCHIIDGCVYFFCKDCKFKSQDILEMNSHSLEHSSATRGFPQSQALVQPPTFKKRRVVSWCQMCGESFTNKLVAKKHKRTCPALQRRAESVEYDETTSSEQQLLPDGTPVTHILDLAKQTLLGLQEVPEPELRTPQPLMVIKAVCDQLAMLTPP